ncbi:MAG: lytic transglycosylase domain-containing protein [Deltaproteobacteria bacterium]|nr:lytic transglycosylase domain-containing protein [Deltaproteobacteria bacterium]
MDNDSQIKKVPGIWISGIISIVIFISFIVFPSQGIYGSTEPLFKEARPCAMLDVTSADSLKVYPHLKATTKEYLFQPIIFKAANRYSVDPALIKAIIMAESSYDPLAESYKGAKGLMQLMPATADFFGVQDLFNPEDNIDAGVQYLRKLIVQFEGDLELAIAAYNAGSKIVRQYDGVPPFKETRYYVKKVFQYYNEYQGI